MATTNSGFFMQNTFAPVGNFDVVVPTARGGLVHVWRDNNSEGFPWKEPAFFYSDFPDGASLIQGLDTDHPAGEMEVVLRVGDRLAHIVCQCEPAAAGQPGFEHSRWKPPVFFGSGISGRAAFIQSRFGTKGNYEVVAPLASGGLAHYSRNNDDPAEPWSEPAVFGTELGIVDAVGLIESNFGDPGNLEVVVRAANALCHFWRDAELAWNGPTPVPLAGVADTTNPTGIHSFMQSRYGAKGNFEIVVPLSTGGLAHITRNNDDGGLPWSPVTVFGTGDFTEAAAVHSSFDNLELIARQGDRFDHYFRDAGSGTWSGPTAVAYEEPPVDPASGDWRIPFSSPVMGLHAAQLHTGQLLLFSYEDTEDVGPGDSCVFDPVSGNSERLPTLDRSPFCGGHSFLPDGRLLVAGGTERGVNSLHVFVPDGASGSWQDLPDLPEGRWYPTCTTLPDGRVFILSGTVQGGGQPDQPVNDTYEIYSAEGGLGDRVPAPYLNEVAPVSVYPFVFVLPTHKLFIHAWNKTCLLDLDSFEFEDRRILTLRSEPRNYPVQGTVVLLPLLPTTNPPYQPRVMLIGGGGVPPDLKMPATETCEILDLSDEPLTWRAAPSLAGGRVMGDAVLLPDGNVLVMNGSRTGWAHTADEPVLDVELFQPADNTWTTVAAMRVPRLYHSTAILLADGRVMTSGSDHDYNVPPFNYAELRLEVYSPPYLFRGPRPVITNVPQQIAYGNGFTVRTSNAASIASAALLRPGAATHSLNMEQRYVGLSIQSRTSQSLTLQAPPDGFVAPPGYYMLFIVNGEGVPSEGKFVRLS